MIHDEDASSTIGGAVPHMRSRYAARSSAAMRTFASPPASSIATAVGSIASIPSLASAHSIGSGDFLSAQANRSSKAARRRIPIAFTQGVAQQSSVGRRERRKPSEVEERPISERQNVERSHGLSTPARHDFD